MRRFFLGMLSIIFAMPCLSSSVQQSGAKLSVCKKNTNVRKMLFTIGVLGNDSYLDELVYYLKVMLSCEHFKALGFNVLLERFQDIPTKQQLEIIYKRGAHLLCLLQKSNETIKWSVIDTCKAQIITAKQSIMPICPVRFFAEHLADQLWLLCTGKEGFFSTRIACCKETEIGRKNLCLIPPYGNPTEAKYHKFIDILVPHEKIIAPRWNMDPTMPIVLYSKATNANICLMSVTLDKKQHMVSNFRGLNLLPSFSSCAKKVAFCLSYQGKSNIYLYEQTKENRSAFKRITFNDGNNISPTLLSNSDIIFCSDFKDKSPKICYWHSENNQIEILTPNTYASCPAYHEKNKKIAYCAFVDGYMQIHVYDQKTKKHSQLTYDFTHKQECSWSPCGNFLVYGADRGKERLIKLLHCTTGEQCTITPANSRWTYPHWSPQYNLPLIVG